MDSILLISKELTILAKLSMDDYFYYAPDASTLVV